jgi:hypothetical protein
MHLVAQESFFFFWGGRGHCMLGVCIMKARGNDRVPFAADRAFVVTLSTTRGSVWLRSLLVLYYYLRAVASFTSSFVGTGKNALDLWSKRAGLLLERGSVSLAR